MQPVTRNILVVVACIFVLGAFFTATNAQRTGNGLYTGSILQAPFVWLAKPFVWLGNFFHQMRFAQSENQALREQNRVLSERIAAYEAQKQDAGFAQHPVSVSGSVVKKNAHVLGFVFGSGGGKLVIDAGSRDGVHQYDWIIIPDKMLVGRVETVRDTTSIVTTLYDPNLKIAATFGARGTGLFSMKQGQFVLEYIPAQAVVHEGDVVLTSGQDGMFRAGLILGTIRSVQASSDASTQNAVVDPVFSLDQIGNVTIVQNSLK